MRIRIFTIAVLFTCTVASAQNITAYYNSSYVHADEANPAFTPDCRTVISLPGVQASSHSSIGAYSLLFPSGNGFVTGLHNSISSDEFLSRIGESAKIDADGCARLFGIGRRTSDKGYLSASLRLRAIGEAELPSDVFRLLKEGSAGADSFDLSCASYNGTVYGEFAIGMTHSFGSLSLGAKAKLLHGIARSRMDIERLHVSTGSEKWSFEGEGAINSAIENFNPGAAVDVGINAQLNDNLTVSAAVLDLGGIAWASASYYRLPGGQWEYSGLTEEIEILDSEDSDALGSGFKSAFNGLRSKLEFVRDGKNAPEFKTLPVSFNAGIKYTLPSWNKLTVGAVASHKSNGMTDVRAIVDLNRLRWLETSASVGMSTNGLRGGLLTVIRLGSVRAHLGGELIGRRYGSFHGLVIPIDKVRLMADFGLQITLR